MAQEEEAREAAFGGTRLPLRLVLESFGHFLANTQTHSTLCGVWGNGAAFDNVVLTNAFRAVGLQMPWSYRLDRCYRTLRALFEDIEAPPFVGVRHTALADALAQADHAQNIMISRGML